MAHSDYPHQGNGDLYDCEDCERMFYTIVFMQDSEAYEVIDMIDNDIDEALAYLKQWDMGDESEHTPRIAPWGPFDRTYASGDYLITWDRNGNYVSLNRKCLPA
jgi:hypothetical protein